MDPTLLRQAFGALGLVIQLAAVTVVAAVAGEWLDDYLATSWIVVALGLSGFVLGSLVLTLGLIRLQKDEDGAPPGDSDA